MNLNQISDRLEIEDLLIRYTRAIDSGDWERLDEVFTPDAEIDYTESGGIADTYPAAKAWLAEVLPAIFPKRMHSLAQIDVAVDGNRATCTAYFHNPMMMVDGEGGEKVVELGGLYHHSLIRTSRGWRSCRLREELVWKRGL